MKKLTALLMVFALAGCGTTGKESSTSEAGGEINVYTRDSSSGTREAFEKASDFEGQLTSKAIEVSSNGDMATKIGSDVNGIGYVSLSTDFEANKVKPLQFEGIEPSEASVLDGSYQMQRPFSYVTRAGGDFASDEQEQLVLAFVDYLQNSTEGRQVVEHAGGVVDVSNATPWAELRKQHPIVDQDNSHLTIITAGSTSVEKTVQAALEAFQSEAGQFQFKMNQTGSGDGYKRVLGSEKDGANAADIGFASRSFNEDEMLSGAMATGQYCVDAVVAIVNQDNAMITNLTQAQIKTIFTGKTTNWEALNN